ncbi:MAG: CBS domain-containing protein, partial [Firmicutes bacterium]|nr:CBS domain-containing protein [Bacillota bacterium]
MKIQDIMTTPVITINPDDSFEHAARLMAEVPCGALPVCDAQDRLVGIITDRDIIVRVVAAQKSLDDPVHTAMTTIQLATCRSSD